METGELTSIIVYALQILMSLNMVTFVFVMIMIAEASTDRIVGVLDEVPEMQDKADAVKNDTCQLTGLHAAENNSSSANRNKDNDYSIYGKHHNR